MTLSNLICHLDAGNGQHIVCTDLLCRALLELGIQGLVGNDLTDLRFVSRGIHLIGGIIFLVF